MRRIPRGNVSTYGAIARAIGISHAARAVGNALHGNQDARVPCHRVVRADFFAGGYNRGIGEKQKRLREEGVVFQGDKIASRCILF